MDHFSSVSILSFCVFSMLTFYQKIHLRNFGGGSDLFNLLLNISVLAASITGLCYLVYYGWSVAWWVPFIIIFIGIFSSFVGVFIERIVGSLALSMAGFFGWPVAAYFMFAYIPN